MTLDPCQNCSHSDSFPLCQLSRIKRVEPARKQGGGLILITCNMDGPTHRVFQPTGVKLNKNLKDLRIVAGCKVCFPRMTNSSCLSFVSCWLINVFHISIQRGHLKTDCKKSNSMIQCHNSPLWNMFSVRMCVIAAVSNMDGWLISFCAEQQQRDRKLMGGNGGYSKERGKKPTNLWGSHCHTTTIFETQGDFQRLSQHLRYDSTTGASRNGRLRLRLWLEHSPRLTSANGNKQQISWMAAKKKMPHWKASMHHKSQGFFQCTKKLHKSPSVTLVKIHSFISSAFKVDETDAFGFFSFWHGMGTTAGYLSQLSCCCCCCCCFATVFAELFCLEKTAFGISGAYYYKYPPHPPKRLVKPTQPQAGKDQGW